MTGGGDGCINVWQIDDKGCLGARTASHPLLLPEAVAVARSNSSAEPAHAPLMIRALDICPKGALAGRTDMRTGDSFLVGTAACDIWEVTPGQPANLALFGHAAPLHSVAMNPKAEFAHVFATVSDSKRVVVWSAATQQV